jgi:plastocyanin
MRPSRAIVQRKQTNMHLVKQAFLALLSSAFGLASIAAHAAAIRVQVVDQTGAPVKDAVIYAMPLSGKLPATRPANAIIDQVKRQFVPLVSVAQTGAAVTFPNKDNIEHDVYSFSPAKRFELELYHGIPASPVVFDKAGLVVMGCNIHDQMVAYLLLVDTPYFAKTDSNGAASIENLPAEPYKVTTWHYQISTPDTLPVRQLNADDGSLTKLTLQLKSE